MRMLALGLVVLAVIGATACGAGRPKALVTADDVANLIRLKWGSTTGSPSFEYSCRRIDERAQLFTCLAKDGTDTVKLASFDVVCEPTCRWTVYPAYAG
jgi:hypothetical protein